MKEKVVLVIKMTISEKKIKAYVLKNSIAYNGKANPGAVVSALFNEDLKKDKVKDVKPKIQKIIKEIGKLSLEEQEKEFESLKNLISEREVREGLPELPDIKKGVIMRFAPSASGPMHIGHALTACLSYLYVKKYGGKLYFRIEDTNPDNIYEPAYKMLEEEAKWLFPDCEVVIQSYRMDLYYRYAEKLIKKNSAYVCTCSGDDFREFVKNKKNCPCRKKSVKENLSDWKKMFSEFKTGEVVLRFKSDMKHKNPAMRDFPLARVNETKHPKQKNKYRVWPLMNLAVAVDDIEMKMTHIIRGKDHRDNAKRQKMIFKTLGKKFPWTSFLGRIHLKGLELSTTKMREGIESGKYSGWDDKELPTLKSLKKQGYKPEAFMKFSEAIGLGENDKTFDRKELFTMLNNFNKSKV